MIGLIGWSGLAASLGQHCPQMTQRPGTLLILVLLLDWEKMEEVLRNWP